jgi:hypothetical protein
MKTCRWALLSVLGVLLLLVCLPLSAQESDRASPGERVRFRYLGEEEQQIQGVFEGTGEGWVLISKGGESEIDRYPFMKVRDFQVARGTENEAKTGAVVGVLTGVSAALVYRPEGDPSHECPGCRTSRQKRIINAILFPLVGGAAGAAIGRSIVADRWVTVTHPSVQPSLQLSPEGRFGLRFSIPTRG